jgi:putative heme-binding domain-containing protein
VPRKSVRAVIGCSIPLVLVSALSCALTVAAAPEERAARKIVLIAGTVHQGPGGHLPGTHEYEKSVRLLRHCLDTAPDLKGIRTEVHFGGWPKDPRTLEDADTIVLVSDGADRKEADHPLLAGDRLKVLEKQMKRGCGLVVLHWTLFVPAKKGGEQFLDWIGGYFDYENGPAATGRSWYSKIQTITTQARPAELRHPICRGLKPFEVKEEFYYNIRFRPGDARRVPILTASIPKEKEQQVVAWAVERTDGGRGFGFTGGHFFDNWKVDGFRKLVLNAIAWTAHAEVPANGVQADIPAEKAPNDYGTKGRFGSALNGRAGYAAVAARPSYRQAPLTAECWTRLDSKTNFNILLASGPKESADHWELYTYAGSGALSVYLPGHTPSEIASKEDITDGKWHHIAMTFDGRRVGLYVDAKQVRDAAVKRVKCGGPEGPLWLGAYPPQNIGCDGLVDEVRLSNVVRKIEQVPDSPYRADESTIGLWHLDESDGETFSDSSRSGNAARKHRHGEPKPRTGTYRVVDPKLQVIRLDHSPNESFVSMRTDTTGRLFVGGREALFVYEPDAKSGYQPRRLLYRFPPDSWVTDIAIRGDDLYVMTAAALYLLPRGRIERDNLRPRRLIWGPPLDLHVTFHGLAWGPEGDLYFNCGDPLLNFGDFKNRPDHWGHWTFHTQPEGTRVPYTGVGGFFRCHPDGSGLQVVATGTRGTDGLAFGPRWDLFSNDNDHESLPADYVPARLLHIAPRANFFWPRGWMTSKTPDRADLLDIVYDGLGREVPVGQAYYDEPNLPAKYRDNLLVARWGQRRVDRFPLTRRGATFRATEQPLLVGTDTVRPVGVAVGRGGRIFVALSYMAANEGSPKYPSDLVLITRSDDSPALPFDGYDAPSASPQRLWQELSSPSWQRRQQAHVEILRRGGTLLREAVERLAHVKPTDPARCHLPWLAGASGTAEAAHLLRQMTEHPDRDLRLQAVRALDAFAELKAPRELFVKKLGDADAQVQHHAVAALFRHRGPLPEELLRGAARSSDSYLRQAAAFLLAEQATPEQLRQLCQSDDAAGRMAGVLAAGFRLTVPPSLGVLPEAVPLRYDHGNAQFVIRYADAVIDLRKHARVGSFTTAARWKLLPRCAEEQSLFELLMQALSDREERVRLQAAYFLGLLNDPRSGPLVERVRRESASSRLAFAPSHTIERAWIIGPFADAAGGLRTVHPPESGAIDLSAHHSSGGRQLEWRTITTTDRFEVSRLVGVAERSSSYLYCRLQTFQRQRLALEITAGDSFKVWHNGRAIGTTSPVLLDLEPGSNDLLVRIHSERGAAAASLKYRASGRVEATLPERLGPATLAERLKASPGGAEKVAKEFLAIDWTIEAKRGDSERGRKLFGADALGCVKCHGILPGQQGGGAPSLTDAGRRFTVAHLVESILLPSKQVAPVFRSALVLTRQGQTFTGLVVEEDDAKVVLLLSDASPRTIDKKGIEERTLQDISPMPSGLVKTPAELRDLLAYLLSDHPAAP